jgi:uncharacterized protein YdiU (UPF0061 family)
MSASDAVGSTGPEITTPAPEEQGATLVDLPKSWNFTCNLPHDTLFATPLESHQTPRDRILPRQVRNALFTWVRPEIQQPSELLGVSPAALGDLGLRPSEATTPEFAQTCVGNLLQGWDESTSSGPGYPWAQCYGGFQFGQWAGQLGDGRAISLFEATNPRTGIRYEVALKGAGMTPYSRFADGKAVLRSSIREFVVSEALHALGIPSTRALALSLLPQSRVHRETVEPGAIVVRFAQSWLRLGNFDILRARGDRTLMRQLATYVAEHVLGGWETLPGRLADADAEKPDGSTLVRRGVGKNEVEGPSGSEENRFTRLYREIVRRNALTVAKWQAYGFMNGVLNTDNTSVFGLSMDFGPFAFLDNFDPAYTPNHDDHSLRYSYRNQPTIIWWNLVRLGEALGELIGTGAACDDESFVASGVADEKAAEPIIARAETLIGQVGEEYKAVFLTEYKRLMTARLGLKQFRDSDFDDLFSNLLDTMEALELDFNHFFRRLSKLPVAELGTEEERRTQAVRFFHGGKATSVGEDATGRVGQWLGTWQTRIREDWGEGEGEQRIVSQERDADRMEAMKRVNPNFVPRGWILDEIIRRVEKEDERDVLKRVMHLALHPFEDTWAGNTIDGMTYQGDKEEEVRWVGDVPKAGQAMQCSCSS